MRLGCGGRRWQGSGVGPAVGLAAALVLVLLALAAVAGLPRPAAGATPASGSKAVMSGGCSRQTALRVAKPFFVWGRDVRTPVAQVLCGPFTGPGSAAMAVTFSAPTCWSPQGWAVFRRVGGVWRVATRQGGWLEGPLVAVGSGIRETAPIFVTGDNRCNPSGGARTRVWRWSGGRLAAGAWQLTAAAEHLQQFLSPDRQIWCELDDIPGVRHAWCGYGGASGQPGPEHSGALHPDGRVEICNVGPGGLCMQNWNSTAPVLAVGRIDELYGYRCVSEASGIRCIVIAGAGKGDGFLIDDAGVTKIGQ